MRTILFTATTVVAGIALTAHAAVAGPAPTAVPEPASLALLAGGVGALAIIKLRRRK